MSEQAGTPPQGASADTPQTPEANQELQRNFNDEVFVKVTPLGEEMWNEYHADARAGDSTAFQLQRDDEGYTRMQLSEVAHIFGPGLTTGFDLPIEPTFKFEK